MQDTIVYQAIYPTNFNRKQPRIFHAFPVVDGKQDWSFCGEVIRGGIPWNEEEPPALVCKRCAKKMARKQEVEDNLPWIRDLASITGDGSGSKGKK